ncbi:MAG: anhydro-N-acetylmuramic acid kinase [candidate division Zixibacteria bacterium]|nr:anhydro-N-acetylmuramic acid kinase [candidate division Zixibacteria bacterium]
MLMQRLLQRRRLVVLGLNSGTSADGLDLAVVRISRSQTGLRTTFIHGHTVPYSKTLRERVLKLADARTVTLEEVVLLDNLLGQFYGQQAASCCDDMAARNTKLHLVASHGQTVRHIPQITRIGPYHVNGTLQLGSLDQIAAVTGLPVVGDFRQADIAIGGEGAPITTGAVQRLFGTQKSRLIVNIGGMANYFYLPGRQTRFTLMACDCGPGNSLSDILTAQLFHRPFDRDGRLARKGHASQRLMLYLQKEEFFKGQAQSTGRETFGVYMADKMIKHGRKLGLGNVDLVATAAELTAITIAEAVQPLLEDDTSLSKLYLTGGGRNNMFIRERLDAHLPDLEVGLIDDLGLDGDYVEAASYAVIGEACLRSEPINRTTRTGAAQTLRPVLGHIAQPPA